MSYTNFPLNKSKFVAYLYTGWVAVWFTIIFLLLFPFYWLALQKLQWKPYAHQLNRIWAKSLFVIIGIKLDIRYDFKPEENGTYVFVTNHFSYFDIACLGTFINNYFAFVGKSSVKNIPLIGYMFRKLHIQVDRSEKESRAISMVRSIKALESGRSMMMFAEGGIITQNPPQMAYPFKDGAFIMAIQMQKPIVPISLLNNHQIIWHDDLLLTRLPVKAVIHQPIETIGLKMEDLENLKEKVWNIIQNELNNYHKI
jgi:1-acyl-sn-glycerol-3-phosphate acyltransferase